MDKHDVVIAGAGVAGLTTGALLAKEAKRVAVFEKAAVPGGRALEVEDQGFKTLVGGHLLEDGGSGVTKILEHFGKELVHGQVNRELPVWDHETRKWERAARAGLTVVEDDLGHRISGFEGTWRY